MQNAAPPDYQKLYEQSPLEVLYLKQQLSQLQKMIFGSRKEHFVSAETNPAQLSLGIQVDAVAACSVTEVQKISYTKTTSTVEQKPLVHPGRIKLPESLRREVIAIEPSAESHYPAIFKHV